MDEQGTGQDNVRKRATTDQRNIVSKELSAALSRGQIDITEFDMRSNIIWSATFVDELEPLLIDLIDDPKLFLSPRPRRTHSTGLTHTFGDLEFADDAAHRLSRHVTGEQGGSALTVSIMGEVTRNGDWLVPNSLQSVAVMGETVLDLRHARLESSQTHIKAFALMAEITIIVPEGMRVDCQGMAVMGEFSVNGTSDRIISANQLPVDAPTLLVDGLALMGSVSIETRR